MYSDLSSVDQSQKADLLFNALLETLGQSETLEVRNVSVFLEVDPCKANAQGDLNVLDDLITSVGSKPTRFARRLITRLDKSFLTKKISQHINRLENDLGCEINVTVEDYQSCAKCTKLELVSTRLDTAVYVTFCLDH